MVALGIAFSIGLQLVYRTRPAHLVPAAREFGCEALVGEGDLGSFGDIFEGDGDEGFFRRGPSCWPR
jgi:hypothetical protein